MGDEERKTRRGRDGAIEKYFLRFFSLDSNGDLYYLECNGFV